MNREKIIEFIKQEWPETIVDGVFTYKSYELYRINEESFEQKKGVLDNLKALALETTEYLPCYIVYFQDFKSNNFYAGVLIKDGKICEKSEEQKQNIEKGIFE